MQSESKRSNNTNTRGCESVQNTHTHICLQYQVINKIRNYNQIKYLVYFMIKFTVTYFGTRNKIVQAKD